jgi:hypothetical protein
VDELPIIPTGQSQAAPHPDLATLLADMDSRLQMLQQELEAVAIPIARSGWDRRRPPRGPEGEGSDGGALREERRAGVDSGTPIASRASTELAARPPGAAMGLRGARSQGPDGPSRGGSESSGGVPEGPRKRARRRAADTATALPPAAPAVPAHPAPAAGALSLASEAGVLQTIREAEIEARRVVENARDRIAAIGADTRALLESLAGDERTLASRYPAPRMPPARSADPSQRPYYGTVVVAAGPFDDVGELREFESALASVPAVEDAYIRSFEHRHAHFELYVAEPTALIAELQARSSVALRVTEAGDRDVCFELARDAAVAERRS